MKNPAKEVVKNMFAAFSSGDADKFVATVSDDTVWIYHGTQIIPKRRFEKKVGVTAFYTIIIEIINFEPLQCIVEGIMVVVIGQEHQKIKRSGRELKQN
ncbi:nuclear transport factor 2 family protein [Bizionia myxarmorum]|uniref:SnoaL-like domain-containing protein n=1 Tax=Bizionia myxarmorum TaxID=291186 RepID=A0A5D0R4U1_9FLAO|nr:nuclear transport factor 2 family protein [Bizionia myxarmorum]TYB75881.1 hypothetical protein ES674_13765 [Bizionia myxarmorum]